MYISIIISSNFPDFIERELNALKSSLHIRQISDHPDLKILKVEKTQTISIKQVRDLLTWAKHKPYEALVKLGVIHNADLLTREAQNALLKLLEEPNPSTQIVLVAENHKKLLPTVLSRCRLVSHYKKNISNEKLDFLKLNTLEKFSYIDNLLVSKDQHTVNNNIQDFLLGLLNLYRDELLLNSSNKGIISNIELVNETVKKINKNVAKKIALENLIINLQ